MLTITAEKKVQTENLVPLSISTIYEEMIKSEVGSSLTWDRVKAAFSCLCAGESDVDDESYLKILEQAQNNEVKYVEKMGTPTILYEYVLMERLVFLSWKVDKAIVWKHVLEEMFQAVFLINPGIKAKWACNLIDAILPIK
ncbi:hypothetical protein ACFX2I_022916 [Malus domestica]